MKNLNEILERIIGRVNVNLMEMSFDVRPYLESLVSPEKFTKFYSFYGLSERLPFYLSFSRSSLAGSYFFGRCVARDSILYKTDVRGDELKQKGDTLEFGDMSVPVLHDEEINIKYSYLAKTLIHNFSHDKEEPELFFIKNTAAMPYSNIHGAPVEGCFLGAFATIDLTTVHNCVIGEFAYVQTGEMAHYFIKPGQIWISAPGAFNFQYQYDSDELKKYVSHDPGLSPKGIIIDFVESYKSKFSSVYDTMAYSGVCFMGVGKGSSVSPYCVVCGDYTLDENVLVAQRAYIEDSYLGTGANAQENCYIINSHLSGLNVTAHGGKIINAHLGKKVFVGFNSFLRGGEGRTLKIGQDSIVMPHTIIDLEEPLEIPPATLVWGLIRNNSDLAENSASLKEIETVKDGELNRGRLHFNGDGEAFVHAFSNRIQHILEANGAFWEGKDEKIGHAQRSQSFAYNTIQPYADGDLAGVYPTIDIRP